MARFFSCTDSTMLWGAAVAAVASIVLHQLLQLPLLPLLFRLLRLNRPFGPPSDFATMTTRLCCERPSLFLFLSLFLSQSLWSISSHRSETGAHGRDHNGEWDVEGIVFDVCDVGRKEKRSQNVTVKIENENFWMKGGEAL